MSLSAGDHLAKSVQMNSDKVAEKGSVYGGIAVRESLSLPLRSDLSEILSRRRLPALDGLRAIAVFTVIIYHFGFDSVPGDLGVSAFFVLSGFLITWLLLQEFNQTGHISIGGFYFRRFLRIAPAYYGFLLIIYVEERLRGYHWDWSLLLSGLLYVVNYYNAFNGHPNTAIAHAWSLGVEQQFYLIWPILISILLPKGQKFAAIVIAGIVVVVTGWRSIAYLGFGADPSYVYNAFETRLDCLAVGCLFAICCGWSWFRDLSVALCRWALIPIVILVILLFSRISGSERYHYSIGFTVDSLLLAVLMVQLLLMHQDPLWSWIDHPVMVYLGRISYSLYLYHVLVLGIGHRLLSASWGVELPMTILFCLIVASGSYWMIERPFLRFREESSRRHVAP
jgi:peptidoglycan/LPS O-acetylase OafA/YrhL